jgi:tetratricopeptide (TPR) repeat protein
MVVFDNLISYVFFAVFLALIHQRVATPWPKVEQYKISPVYTQQLIAPLVLVALIATVYYVNIPSRAAAIDLIDAMRTTDVSERYEIFDRALTRGSFGQQEIVEQFVQQTIQVTQTEGVPPELVAQFTTRAEAEIRAMIERKPGDARLHVFAASYYRAINELDRAAEELAIARTLSPNKQSIIMQQGANALAQANPVLARDFFREAFVLDERYSLAREYYVAMLLDTGARDEAIALLEAGDEAFQNSLAQNDFVINLLNSKGEFALLTELFERRVNLDGSQPQTWASLSYLYYQNQQTEEAIAVLERAAIAIPQFASTSACLIDNMRAGREPEANCI